MNTLKNTAFKGGNVTDEQFTALLIVANQYGLNPWTKEIYAFPDKGGIVRSSALMDGLALSTNILSLTAWSSLTTRKRRRVHLQDLPQRPQAPDNRHRVHGRVQTQHSAMAVHPTRMLRHKTLIQCARLAFGFAGIFDQDEAERVIEGTTAEVHAGHESDSRRPDLIAKVSPPRALEPLSIRSSGWR
jgi:hypothetical protein